jgi:hypothetical protein
VQRNGGRGPNVEIHIPPMVFASAHRDFSKPELLRSANMPVGRVRDVSNARTPETRGGA